MVFEGTMSGRMARTTIAEGFHILPGMGNCLAAETDAGMVIVDGGPVGVAPRGVTARTFVTRVDSQIKPLNDGPEHPW
jgi:hypothetical protein